MAQITNVTSENLQAKIRQLLPSQQGFGEDLQAQNVIVPIIDLTETAEGSVLRSDLQTAINLTDATTFDVTNSSTTLISTPGFYRIIGTAIVIEGTGGTREGYIRLTDGVSTKIVYNVSSFNTSYQASYVDDFDFVIYLNSGEAIQIFAVTTFARMAGSVRQIADVNGNLINPSGFTSE